MIDAAEAEGCRMISAAEMIHAKDVLDKPSG